MNRMDLINSTLTFLYFKDLQACFIDFVVLVLCCLLSKASFEKNRIDVGPWF